MKHTYRLTRRAALKTALVGAALPLVHVRTGHAAGILANVLTATGDYGGAAQLWRQA